jgi:hypothetical protein
MLVVVRLVSFLGLFLYTKVAAQSGSRSNIFFHVSEHGNTVSCANNHFPAQFPAFVLDSIITPRHDLPLV